MATDKIKRNFVWLRKALGIIQKTTLPGEILGEVRPVLDTFGWDRLEQEQVLSFNAAAPAFAVASSTPPPDVLRLVTHASVEHSDGVATHTAWILKRRNPGAIDVGVPTDRRAIEAGEFLSMQGKTFLLENEFLVAEMIGAPLVGAMSLRMWVVDLDLGEYLPPIS